MAVIAQNRATANDLLYASATPESDLVGPTMRDLAAQ
jgi:hypothetical protein